MVRCRIANCSKAGDRLQGGECRFRGAPVPALAAIQTGGIPAFDRERRRAMDESALAHPGARTRCGDRLSGLWRPLPPFGDPAIRPMVDVILSDLDSQPFQERLLKGS